MKTYNAPVHSLSRDSRVFVSRYKRRHGWHSQNIATWWSKNIRSHSQSAQKIHSPTSAPSGGLETNWRRPSYTHHITSPGSTFATRTLRPFQESKAQNKNIQCQTHAAFCTNIGRLDLEQRARAVALSTCVMRRAVSLDDLASKISPEHQSRRVTPVSAQLDARQTC